MNARSSHWWLSLTSLALLTACAPPSPQPAQDAAAEASADVADVTTVEDTGSDLCGADRCAAGDVCVRPCCIGTTPRCVDRTDAGQCPDTAEFGVCQLDGVLMQGCRYVCTPPPPFCAPAPTNGCNGANCSVCPSGNGRRQGDQVLCQCA